MIIFCAPGGRIGNLLFQLAYIESIRQPKEWVLATQLKGITHILKGFETYRNSDSSILIKILDHVLIPLIVRPLIFLRILGSHIEHNGVLKKKKGLLPVWWVQGYFQYGKAQNESGSSIGRLHLLPEMVALSQALFDAHPSEAPIFVHVRRGDYRDFTVMDGVAPLLPEEWYRRSLDVLLGLFPKKKTHTFVVGDDPDWSESVFSGYPNLTVCRSDALHDLSLMVRCAGGVVSNSTFAWWGASLGLAKKKIIAPRYWLGWQKRVWYPSTIETPGFTYIDVVQGE